MEDFSQVRARARLIGINMLPSTTQTTATKFTMRGLPLLSSGVATEELAQGDHVRLHSKVYSRGGENTLHAHMDEDHAFFVLQGAAVFTFGDGSSFRVERFEGVLIPCATKYRFEAEEAEHLIMIRVGGYAERPDATGGSAGHVVDAADRPFLSDQSADRGRTPAEPIVAIPGRFFEPYS